MNPIDGKWRVEVTSGKWWFRWVFFWFPDIKVIDGDSGYNVMAGIKLGKFTIHEKSGGFYLVYEDHPIIDIVRFVSDDKLSGRFYKDHKHVGDFTLTRVTSPPKEPS